MKIYIRIFLLFFFALLLCCNSDNSKTVQIDYFGLPEPGLRPQPFGQDVFDQYKFLLHGFPSFSPDGKQVCWPVVPPRILTMTYENNKWSAPESAPFSERNIQAPCWSPDGRKLWFQMSRAEGYGSLDLWTVTKTDTGWSEKQNAGSPPNSPSLESQPSLTKSGTIYFTGIYEQGFMQRGIYRCEYQNGAYAGPELLPEQINTPYLDYTPFIAPDESFLLFASTRPDTLESSIRLYVSFHTDKDTWTEPVNLNDAMEFDQASRFPCLTPDGKFIIFQSGRGFYWLSSDIIEKCRNTKI
ncbi:PD40 domain-containing protein [candidate division KSB1 bacterium]|nr:PD40 domain-containing protein [candidate division KSB1 bacterium]